MEMFYRLNVYIDVYKIHMNDGAVTEPNMGKVKARIVSKSNTI